MNPNNYADCIILTKTKSGKWRYSCRYKNNGEKEVLREAKTHSTPTKAFQASSKAMKAKSNGKLNLIE
jgi:hypothetical protein